MRRPAALAAIAAALLAACSPGSEPPPPGEPPPQAEPAQPAGGVRPKGRPNIVLIVIDTLRADHLSFHGYAHPTAPFLAGLAAGGVLFENAYSTSSWTAPATASIFTSLYPNQHGIVTGRAVTYQMRRKMDRSIQLNRIPEELETLPEAMKSAGYATWGISDNHNVCTEMGFADGFDEFVSDPEQNRGGEYVNGVLRGWKEGLASGSPYFLYVHYMDPHQPYHLWQPFFRRPKDVPVEERPPHLEEIGRLYDVALYDSEISYVDLRIREIFEALGWDRNTLLIVTSDHGEEFWDHGFVHHDKTLYEEMLHVPLILYDTTGGLPSGRVAAPAGIIDILPTLREIAGLPPDPRAMGRSLLPLIGGDAGTVRDLFAHLDRTFFRPWGAHQTLRAEDGREHYVAWSVRRGPWKLVTDSRGDALLFDLSADPGETSSLFEARPDVAADLTAALDTFRRTAKTYLSPAIEESLTPEEIERLRTLGYVE